MRMISRLSQEQFKNQEKDSRRKFHQEDSRFKIQEYSRSRFKTQRFKNQEKT